MSNSTQLHAEIVRVVEETHLLCSITDVKIKPGEPRLRLFIDGTALEGVVFSASFEEVPHLMREWLLEYATAHRESYEEALDLIAAIEAFATAEVTS